MFSGLSPSQVSQSKFRQQKIQVVATLPWLLSKVKNKHSSTISHHKTPPLHNLKDNAADPTTLFYIF